MSRNCSHLAAFRNFLKTLERNFGNVARFSELYLSYLALSAADARVRTTDLLITNLLEVTECRQLSNFFVFGYLRDSVIFRAASQKNLGHSIADIRSVS